MKIGITAPSSLVPQNEFKLGLAKIRETGIHLQVSEQCKSAHWFFAGTDEERAKAFYNFAKDPSLAAIWCARGGYGSMRLLPLLEKLSFRHGKPSPKLLIGYSDATALSEFVRARWGWSVLHASMPGLRQFVQLPKKDWKASVSFIQGKSPKNPWGKKKLHVLGSVPPSGIDAELIGGNLTVWNSMVGTPYLGVAKGKAIFFEDTDESLYRLDRMIQQLLWSGALEGARAIVLGNFQNCRDSVGLALKKPRLLASPKPKDLVPIRARLNEKKLIPEIFQQLSESLKIPLFYSLPVGHGPDKAPLPLGARYHLGADGSFNLLEWNWLKPKSSK